MNVVIATTFPQPVSSQLAYQSTANEMLQIELSIIRLQSSAQTNQAVPLYGRALCPPLWAWLNKSKASFGGPTQLLAQFTAVESLCSPYTYYKERL